MNRAERRRAARQIIKEERRAGRSKLRFPGAIGMVAKMLAMREIGLKPVAATA